MPFTCVCLFLWLVFAIVFVQNDVNITDSGVIPWIEGDFAITFYVTLNNFGNRPVTVVAEMIKCCEQITETDCYCDHFKLIGSNMDLEARRIKSITLLYLNIYSYNRRGHCDIRINVLFNDVGRTKSTIVKTIKFDTRLTSPESNMSRGNYEMKKCQYPDEDPLDYCLPVNCHMKYSGYRGFYSASMKKCISIPICKSNGVSEQVYLWSSNQCANLNNTVSQKDVREVLNMIDKDKNDELQPRQFDTMISSQKVRCRHGRLNTLTDLCECDPGWESEEDLEWDDFIPSTVPIEMCTVRAREEMSENATEILDDGAMPEDWTVAELIYSVLLGCAFTLLPSYFIYDAFLLYASEFGDAKTR